MGRKLLWWCLPPVLLRTMLLCVCAGGVPLSPGGTLQILWRGLTGTEAGGSGEAIILRVRLPRVLCVALTGASLSLCGAAMQGLLRNPLADGSTLGVSSGASLGAVLAIVLGIILANIVIPLPGGAEFSLGTSGGPLIAGLILGHFGKVGKLSMKVETHVLECPRAFGLALFLIGAGVQAGAGLVETLRAAGLVLFLYGAIITLIPMLIGYFFAAKVLRLSLFNTLGSICGGMTSTPALGTLIRVTETDDVASAYAATYPVALVFVVLACQFIGIFL